MNKINSSHGMIVHRIFVVRNFLSLPIGSEYPQDLFVVRSWQGERAPYKPALRDGPLEKLWGGRGIFEPQEFFFLIKFLVGIFFRP